MSLSLRQVLQSDRTLWDSCPRYTKSSSLVARIKSQQLKRRSIIPRSINQSLLVQHQVISWHFPNWAGLDHSHWVIDSPPQSRTRLNDGRPSLVRISGWILTDNDSKLLDNLGMKVSNQLSISQYCRHYPWHLCKDLIPSHLYIYEAVDISTKHVMWMVMDLLVRRLPSW